MTTNETSGMEGSGKHVTGTSTLKAGLAQMFKGGVFFFGPSMRMCCRQLGRRAYATISMTVREALNKALDGELERDPKVFIMGEEVGEYNGAYKITKDLHAKYGPRRVVDTPITEAGFTGLAVGAALAGLRPVCEFMTFNFSMQAIDHVVNSAAKTRYMSGGQLKCPLVFRGPNGMAAGVGAQHSQCFAAWYSSVPGLKVISPWNAEDCLGLLRAAIRDENPVVFLENELVYGEAFPIDDACLKPEWTLPIGKSKIEREGTNITLCTHSRSVGFCLQAAKELEAAGVSAEVLNLRTLRPLDRESIVKSVMKTGRLLAVEEGWYQSGVAAEIIASVSESEAFDYLDAPMERICGADVPMPYAQHLEVACVPSIADIVRVAKRVCGVP